MQRGHIHKPYISHINPHKLVNKTPVSCPCGVPESLRPSSIESNRVYTCIPSMLLAEWSKQQAVHDDLSYLWIDHLHLWVYHILPLRTYFRVPDMWGVSGEAGATGCSERTGSRRPEVSCHQMQWEDSAPASANLRLALIHGGQWWRMMDNDG